jgi:hypothetical protein
VQKAGVTGVQRSHRLAFVACLCVLLAGCTSRSYFVTDMTVGISDEERETLLANLGAGGLADKSPGDRDFTFYSGKMLVTGSSILSRKQRERLDVTVRNGWILSAHRNIQMIRVRWFICGNISGHGGFCGTESHNQCEKWGNHDLRRSCPPAIDPAYAATARAEAAKAAPYIQSATVHTAGPPTIVRKSAGDVAVGASSQP